MQENIATPRVSGVPFAVYPSYPSDRERDNVDGTHLSYDYSETWFNLVDADTGCLAVPVPACWRVIPSPSTLGDWARLGGCRSADSTVIAECSSRQH